ncbi:hypothetical protein [Marivita sp. S2033]|uniref:hypothetical protein n=1 Tax=Marivita sp. S2033 TaxID=3373187 RepID=UPI0039825CBC
MACQSDSATTYKACPAQGLRAEFGVCRGDPIRRLTDLVPGDIYQVKPDALWSSVTAQGGTTDRFTRSVAANLPADTLNTLAQLIFMTTTGRRADIYATVCNGELYFIGETEMQSGVEYVLIDMSMCDLAFEPVIVPTPVAAGEPSNVIALRAVG